MSKLRERAFTTAVVRLPTPVWLASLAKYWSNVSRDSNDDNYFYYVNKNTDKKCGKSKIYMFENNPNIRTHAT